MKLLYFAWVRQTLGRSEEEFSLAPHIATVAQLANFLCERGDGYADVFSDPRRLRAAVNQEHASWNAVVRDEDEIAFFPPVTGG